jgi:hypothetical protein
MTADSVQAPVVNAVRRRIGVARESRHSEITWSESDGVA